MKIYLYKGGSSIVGKSGVGSAIRHQEKLLRDAGAPLTEDWQEATVVHINTVFPDSWLTAKKARREGKKVVYYGHSTMEDFKNSFIGSNLTAPLFKKWICACYRQGDFVLTPTEYSKRLLEGYGLGRPVYALSNGVDTEFFRRDAEAGMRFRRRYRISEGKKTVISAGHLIARKGILDFLDTARQMPEAAFFWFGGGNDLWIPREIKRAVQNKPENVCFAGFVSPEELRDAYCGADAFAFFSREETEGIVILEALACEIPVVVRDIPVYEGWLESGVQVYKAADQESWRKALRRVLYEDCTQMRRAGRALAKSRSLERVAEKLNVIYQRARVEF